MGEVQHWHRIRQFHLELACVQVQVAQRASDDHGICSRLAGVLDQISAKFEHDIRAAERVRRTAADGLVRPVQHLRPGCRQQLVHVGGILRVLGSGHLRWAGEQAAVITHYPQTFKRFFGFCCDCLLAYMIEDCFRQRADAHSILIGVVQRFFYLLLVRLLLVDFVQRSFVAVEAGCARHGHFLKAALLDQR